MLLIGVVTSNIQKFKMQKGTNMKTLINLKPRHTFLEKFDISSSYGKCDKNLYWDP